MQTALFVSPAWPQINPGVVMLNVYEIVAQFKDAFGIMDRLFLCTQHQARVGGNARNYE